MPTLTIDNLDVSVPEGSSLLAAAERLGIVVPHLCYHRALGAVGACRMCAVTVLEGSRTGLQMACLVPAEQGMVVSTQDEQAQAFRQRVGEWLMTNHPHDCPVCDEGGECQLQEMTIASGQGLRRYRGNKRTYRNQDLGPFIAQEMNRCIQCYRCVRTYQDYCGGRDFGALGSRQRVFFGRFADGPLQSDFSGNLADVCPTGVLTDKTCRFRSRSWDLQQGPSICPHCSLGCATLPGGRYRQLQRVKAGVNRQTNGFFICDRGRFGSGYVNHPERPRQARVDGRSVTVEEAIDRLWQQLVQIVAEHGPEAVQLVGSGRASLEANWLLQRWADELKSPPPIFELHPRRSRAAQVVVGPLAGQLASLEQVRSSDLLLLVGADPLAEGPMLALALRQAVRAGGRLLVLDPRPVELPCDFEQHPLTQEQLLRLLAGVGEDALFKELLEALRQARQPVLVAGSDLLGGVGMNLVEQLADSCSTEQRDCLVHPLLPRPNSFAAALLSEAPERDLLERLESGSVKGLICLECDPCVDHPQPGRMQLALSRLACLAIFDHLPTRAAKRADILIPTAAVVESDGVFINNEGRMQAFARVLEPGLPIETTGGGDHPPREFLPTTPGSAPLPAWQLLLQLQQQRSSLGQLRRQLEQASPFLAGLSRLQPGDEGRRVAPRQLDPVAESRNEIWSQSGELRLLAVTARYGSDLASSLSPQLQPRLQHPQLWLHPQEAEQRGLKEGELVRLETEYGCFQLPLVCRQGMAPGRAMVPYLPGTPLEALPPGGLSLSCRIGREESHA